MDLGYDVIVTITGIVLVFLILVLLMAIITLEGKIFDAMNGKKAAAKAASAAKPAAPVKQAAAPAPAKAAAPQVEAGIPGDARKAILDEIMLPCIPAPRPEVSQYAPKMLTMKIDPDKIREVIGSGGKVIQKITAESGAKIDIEDDGTIYISAENAACCDAAKKMIDTIVFVPEVGMLYYGKVVRILNFGAFVELAPGKDGMVHISKLAERRVEKVEDVVNIGDMVWVKVTDIDEKGRVNLSLRDAQREIAAMEARDAKKHQN